MLTAGDASIQFTINQNDLEPAEFASYAEDFRSTLEKNVYPKVPTDVLSKIKDRALRIRFVPLRLGGQFTPPRTDGGELQILLRQSSLKLPGTSSRLLHEWFHVLHYLNDANFVQQPSWLKEGLAQLFVYRSLPISSVLRYPGEGLRIATAQSTTGLQHEFNILADEEEAYGHVFLYFLYLYKHCGGDALFWNLTRGHQTLLGEAWIDESLKGSDPKWCGSFAHTAEIAEIARVHQHIVMGPTHHDDHYYLLPENQGKPFTISGPELAVTKTFTQLAPFQPILFSGKTLGKIQKLNLDPNQFHSFTLQKSYPWEVSPGLPPLKTIADDTNESILIIRVKK